MKQTMHLILKYNDNVYHVDSIKQHQDIINKNQEVIWGVIKPSPNSPGISKDKIIKVNSQIEEGISTFAFFATEGKVTARGRIRRLLTRDEVHSQLHLVPEYYRKDLEKCVSGILLDNIQSEDSMIINKFQRYGTEGGNVALGNQTNPLYISIIDETDGISEKNILSKSILEGTDWQKLSNDEVKGYLENIVRYINSIGFIYTYENLCNFYLSLKTKPFIILAGISGTGKSKIVRLFAEAAGANSNNRRFRMISVKPDWNDSTELFGYKNIAENFIPGILTEIIEEAIQNIDLPYFICIDEMNLARVEYYFSEYLSLIESRRREGNRILTDNIFSGGSYRDLEYGQLYLPENLYIIGTVNMDDTTFGFSRKVLDRANTIEFSEVDLSNLFPSDEWNDESGNLTLHNDFIKSQYLNLQEIDEEFRIYANSINQNIITINDILKKGNKHFAYRIREEILYYMVENKKLGLLEETVAFDYQIMQKILPSINGSQIIIKDILVDLFNFCLGKKAILSETEYLEDAEEYLKDAIYKRSAEKIIEMLRGYKYDGFSTFWF